MKILYTNFHQGDGGGHTTYVMSLARMLRQRAQITVAAPRSSRLLAEADALPGVQSIDLEFKGRPFQQLSALRRLRALLRKEHFDVIHVNGSADHRLCMLATMGMGAKRPFIVYTQHTDRTANSLGVRMRAKWGTNRVICVCGHTFRRMKDSVFRNEDLRVVHNGVDTAQFRPASAQDAAQARVALLPAALQRRLVIGSNAGTASYKNWLDMVTAVSLLPDYLRDQVVIMIAGKEPDDEQRQRVTDLGMADQVVFTGLLEDVGPFLAALDVGFVLSSRLETISFACREMMASGKPVIVSKIGGLTENVTDGRNGWVVPPGSVSSVVKVVSEILKNRDAVAQMGIDARNTAKREFSLAQFVGRTEEVYLERRLGTGGHLRLMS
ncbi:glycosyl transferase family 1 [Achromobacter marplatensis]|uniref:Glycosyltransferase involved in cell wall biosynthesis n=1 Tax=Achromobacter marplatensis TaxID=470868 RepID=A0ABX9GDQ1_9BURK|nr:glycosyltransferase [Achromobacter marplatensis]OWT66505.1 glycosyl transferase family 1 [Achromobacter marplatensis]RBP21668.1 glycosyltransferase involved in cell wall biosynthesis [Achromobacter marplatensis]CAB3681022.1 N-acetyl-alpha-D-glucosaminyl L-malate synthase [Achromobacter marplatensis]